ncbi:unnamed protein product [Ascophyllum nodosum]
MMVVLGTSARGTSRIFVVMLAGFLASMLPKNEPLLTRESCRTASRMCTLLFQPALMVASIGSTLTLSSLQDSWQLAIGASFTILMSFATAWLFGRVFLRPHARRDFLPVQLAIAFPNAGAVPLLMMDSLCQQDTVSSDFKGDSEECLRSATAMIFIYLVVWQLLFYSWGFYALENNRTLELTLSGHQSMDSSGGSTRTVDDEEQKDNTPGTQLMPLRVPRTSKEWSPLLKKQAVPSNDPEANGGEDITIAVRERETPSVDEKWVARFYYARKVMASPNNLAVVVGIAISAIPSLQNMLFNNPRAALWPLGAAVETLGTPTVAVSMVVMAGSLVQVPTVALEANGQEMWNRQRIIMGALHVVCRLIVFPAAGFTLFWLASTKSLVLGTNRLMHLVLLIEFAVPSAAMVIVSLNQLRMPATAGFMARLYIVQYFVSMFTMSAWTTVALEMVY